jgi:hypothetical protein
MGAQRASREEWVRRVASWRRSGETANVFAARYGWNPSNLRWWSSQERRSRADGVAFVEVAAPEPLRTKSGIDVLLANGRRLRVRGDVDPETVARLARALEA